MSNQRQWGFTIIELILFLGITGALFAGLMVGVNTSINTQRYKESATSYKTLMESQYSEVEYPRNERDNTWTCTADAGVVQDPASGQARGSSGCVLLGRYVEITDNGGFVKTGDVIGITPPGTDIDGDSGDGDATAIREMSDLDALIAYTPHRSPIGVRKEAIAWDSRLESSTEKVASKASFLILRSPLSGIIRTFGMEDELPDQLKTAITEDNARSSVKLCVEPAGYVSMPVQSVTINAAIGSANGVVLDGNDELCQR